MKLSLVSYLDPASSTIVREIQQKLSEITGSKASLSSWEPHVTVGDGVEVDNVQELEDRIKSIAQSTNVFQLELSGIETMDNWKGGKGEEVTPFVIYLNANINPSLLQLVDEVAQVSTQFKKWYHMPNPYQPHCTLAFRDLTEEGFRKGLEYLNGQNIHVTATIDHIALVEKLPALDKEFKRFNFSD